MNMPVSDYEMVRTAQNPYIKETFQEVSGSNKLVLLKNPNPRYNGKEQLRNDLARNLTTQNKDALLARTDDSFNLFAQCYNQTLLSFIVNSINQLFGPMGFMATGYRYRVNLSDNPLSITLDNDFLLIGQPQNPEQYFFPGKIKIIYTLGQEGIELTDVQTSNDVLKVLLLGLAKAQNKEDTAKALNNLSFEAMLQESPDNIYQSYRSLVHFLCQSTYAPQSLPFLQKTLNNITFFMKHNPEQAKKVSLDPEFNENLKAIDPKNVLRKEIRKIEHVGLRDFHLHALNTFLAKYQIDETLRDKIELFVDALNKICSKDQTLSYKDYIQFHSTQSIPFAGALGKENYASCMMADKENMTPQRMSQPLSPQTEKKAADAKRSPLRALSVRLF